MREPAFYDIACSGPGIGSWLLVPLRRLARRLLRPFFYRQAEINDEVQARFAELLQRQQRLEAFLCDAHALARRLAVIEDHLQTLLEPSSTTSDVQPTDSPAHLPLRITRLRDDPVA
jgi:hypothetical protein